MVILEVYPQKLQEVLRQAVSLTWSGKAVLPPEFCSEQVQTLLPSATLLQPPAGWLLVVPSLAHPHGIMA